MSDTTEKQRRTEGARAAAAKTFARRRANAAIVELEGQGYRVLPPAQTDIALVFDAKGINRNARGHVEYRCPGCGRGSWYVREADRFYHSDGTDNTVCFRAMHRGATLFPLPEIQQP